MKRLTQYGVVVAVAAVAALSASGVARAHSRSGDCSLKTLRGTYVFAATGNNIMSGVPQPKAIVEVIEFNGDGTLSVPAATRSVNGAVARSLPGGTGSYTVEAGCTGTITFDPVPNAPTFDAFFSLKADTLWMIQTTPNTVFQGTATRLSHDGSGEDDQR